MNRLFKQALAFLLLAAMLLALTACAGQTGSADGTTTGGQTKSTASSGGKTGGKTVQADPGTPESPAVTARPTVYLPLCINEVMLANKATLADENGQFPDWIELYNYGREAISLGGLVLREGNDAWTLPERELAGGGYLVIFCDSGSGELHTGFSLSKDGVDLELEDADGALIEEFQVPACEADRSVYRGEEGSPVITDFPTPGFDNSMDGYAAMMQQRSCASPLQIYETMVYNEWYKPQGGVYYDWVELKNVSDETLALQDWYLSDKGSDRAAFRLPERSLAPGDSVLVFCTGDEEQNGELMAPFGLSAERDQLYLSRADGTLADYVSLHDIPYGCSYGRMDRENGFFYFRQPTPIALNEGGCRLIAEKPALLGRDGIFNNVESVTVTLSAPGEIYYTTDGSAPNANSALYTEPLELTKTTVIRAINIERGKLDSDIQELSFIINEGHTLPVVSLVGEPSEITGPAGLYRNPQWDKETLGSVKFFENGQSFCIDCGIKLHGATSKLAQDKKSFKLNFRSRFDGELHYDLFGNGVTDFSSILLRAAQESTYSTLMRDNLVHQLAIQCFPELPAQDYKYAVLYLNGQYWGVYNIREAHSEEHYAYHYGYDPDSVSHWKENWPADSAMAEVCRFALNRNLEDEENYAYVAQHINVDSVIGWTILQAWCSNYDCNPPNMRYYYSTEDDMMRFALVDLDLGMFNYDGFDVPLKGSAIQGTRYSYAFNKLASKLMNNREYQLRMAEQLSAALRGPMSTENVLALIDEFADEIRPEIQRDRERWGKGGAGDTAEFWEHGFQMVDYLREYVQKRGTRTIVSSFLNNARLTQEEIDYYFNGLM